MQSFNNYQQDPQMNMSGQMNNFFPNMPNFFEDPNFVNLSQEEQQMYMQNVMMMQQQQMMNYGGNYGYGNQNMGFGNQFMDYQGFNEADIMQALMDDEEDDDEEFLEECKDCTCCNGSDFCRDIDQCFCLLKMSTEQQILEDDKTF